MQQGVSILVDSSITKVQFSRQGFLILLFTYVNLYLLVLLFIDPIILSVYNIIVSYDMGGGGGGG